MPTPHGKEWRGVFIALVIVCYGVMFIDNIKLGHDVEEYFTDIFLAIAVAGIATLAWFAWAYLRKYDSPRHDTDKED